MQSGFSFIMKSEVSKGIAAQSTVSGYKEGEGVKLSV